MARFCWGRSTRCFIYGFALQMISEKTLCSKVFTRCLWGIFYENNHNYNSYKSSYKFTYISFSSFCRNQKQESSFKQVGFLVTRNISTFGLREVALYFSDFNGFLLRPCFALYSNSYYTSMLLLNTNTTKGNVPLSYPQLFGLVESLWIKKYFPKY